ncbi:MAG: hypothetical protein J6A51_04375 [Clostridia bacterium]|nr:hypothetical protein [Clostridia bacterium]
MGVIEKFKEWKNREGRFIPVREEDRTNKQHLLAKKGLVWTALAMILLIPFAFLEVFIFKTILQTELVYIIILVVSFLIWMTIAKNAVKFSKDSGSRLSYYTSNAAVVFGVFVIALCLFLPLIALL